MTFIGDDLHYYSCAHSVYSTTRVQYAQSRTAAALFTLQRDCVFQNFFFFVTTLKGVLTLPRGCVCEYYTWHNESSAKMSLLQPPHAVFNTRCFTVNPHMSKRTVCPRSPWIGPELSLYAEYGRLQLVILARPAVSLSRLLAVMRTEPPRVPRPNQLPKVIICMIKSEIE